MEPERLTKLLKEYCIISQAFLDLYLLLNSSLPLDKCFNKFQLLYPFHPSYFISKVMCNSKMFCFCKGFHYIIIKRIPLRILTWPMQNFSEVKCSANHLFHLLLLPTKNKTNTNGKCSKAILSIPFSFSQDSRSFQLAAFLNKWLYTQWDTDEDYYHY